MDTPTAANGTAKAELTGNLRHMVEEAEQLLKSAVSAGDQKFDEGRIRLEHQLRAMRLQLDELEDKASYRARQAARAADQAVHAHPYSAVGVAAAVGLLVGVLVSRR